MGGGGCAANVNGALVVPEAGESGRWCATHHVVEIDWTNGEHVLSVVYGNLWSHRHGIKRQTHIRRYGVEGGFYPWQPECVGHREEPSRVRTCAGGDIRANSVFPVQGSWMNETLGPR